MSDSDKEALLHPNNEPVPCDVLAERLVARKEELGLTVEQIRQLVRDADKNRDDKITMDEFNQMCKKNKAHAKVLKNAFHSRAMHKLADAVTTPGQRVKVHTYIDHYDCLPPPIFIIMISLLQIAAFFYYLFAEPPKQGIMGGCPGCFVKNSTGSRMVGPMMFVPTLRAQAWRFLTYQFLHSGLMHLVGNLVMQLLVGVPLEIVHKIWRIGPLYLTAVIAGSLLQYTFDATVSLVGASAGVYSLITAHLANVFMNWSEMPYRWIRIIVLVVWVGFDVGSTLVNRWWIRGNNCDMVSHTAHMAGGVTGLCMGVFVLYNVVVKKWERVIQWVALSVYVVLFIILLFLAIVRDVDAKPFFDNSCKSIK